MHLIFVLFVPLPGKFTLHYHREKLIAQGSVRNDINGRATWKKLVFSIEKFAMLNFPRDFMLTI